MSAIASQSRRPFTPTLREGLAARPSQFARSTCFEAGHLTSVNAGWRSVRPVFDAEQCTLGLNCYMYCPDGTIAKVRGRGDLHHHLENLGFVEGAQVTVVSEAAGDLIVEVKGIQVALNRQVAAHIITNAAA